MPTLVAASFVTSANRLEPVDAKRVWEFVHKLMDNPAHPSLSLERITQALDRRFWSGRISQGLRAVIHRDGNVNTILYAGRHDDAYQWARTHQLERNAATGELQIVASPEVVKDVVPHVPPRTPGIFAAHDDAYLLSLGLPPDWLPVMRKIVTEDQLLEVIGNLPDDAAERLFDVAAGKLVAPPVSSNGRMRTPDSYEDAKAAMPVVPDIAHPALPADAGKPDE